MRAFNLALALVLALAASARAGPPPLWIVDKTVSKVTFSSSFDGEAFTGRFRNWDASIRFDPANLGGSSATATIDLRSAATGDSSRDEALSEDQWFAAGRFPKATFTAKNFKALGGGRYEASGTLTMRGVTRPLTLPFMLSMNGDVAKMSSTISLNRLAFGVGQAEWKATDVVPGAVVVNITLTARRAH